MDETGVIFVAILHCFSTVGFAYLIKTIIPSLLTYKYFLLVIFGFYFGITLLTIIYYDLLMKEEKIELEIK
jgi:hypothetical protein